jgi:hypothetical protein
MFFRPFVGRTPRGLHGDRGFHCLADRNTLVVRARTELQAILNTLSERVVKKCLLSKRFVPGEGG